MSIKLVKENLQELKLNRHYMQAWVFASLYTLVINRILAKLIT